MATQQEHIEQLKKMTRRPSPPGALLEELLENTGLSQSAAAARMGVARATISRLIHGHHPLTPDLASRLGRLFGNGPSLWLKMQQQVDLWDILHEDEKRYAHIEPVKAA